MWRSLFKTHFDIWSTDPMQTEASRISHLSSKHWLPIYFRADFKVLDLTFGIWHSHLLHPCTEGHFDLLTRACWLFCTLKKRRWSILAGGPMTIENLPLEWCPSVSNDAFKKQLMSYLIKLVLGLVDVAFLEYCAMMLYVHCLFFCQLHLWDFAQWNVL